MSSLQDKETAKRNRFPFIFVGALLHSWLITFPSPSKKKLLSRLQIRLTFIFEPIDI